VGQGLVIHEVSRSHTTTRHIRWDSSGRVISSSQRPLPDNTQHSQQTDIHASGGIRSHNPSKRAAADPRLRPRGHCDRRLGVYYKHEIIIFVKNASFSIFWRGNFFFTKAVLNNSSHSYKAYVSVKHNNLLHKIMFKSTCFDSNGSSSGHPKN